MRPLYTCAACGYLSTLGTEFRRVRGILVDRECLKRAERGEEPVAQWVAEAIATTATPDPRPAIPLGAVSDGER